MEVGTEFAGPARTITWEKMVAFESVVWDRGPTAHNDRSTAAKGGLSRPFASGQNTLAFLHELLEHNFGDGFVEGGAIAVRWTRLVYEGDTIVARARLDAIETEGERRRAALTVWAENQNGEQTAAGTARVYLP